MWGAYAGHATLTALALAADPAAPPLRTGLRAAALGLVAGGTALEIASAARFAGPAQLTGTAAGELITGGIYRYSRNPQYVGLVAVLAGLATLRRSPAAAALTAALAVVYRVWVPAEEQHLAHYFGPPYLRYRAATHRWLGWPHRRTAGGSPRQEPG